MSAKFINSALLLAVSFMGWISTVRAETHAVLVGVGAYPKVSGFKPLQGPANDVELLAGRLRDLRVKSLRVLSSNATQDQDRPNHAIILSAMEDTMLKAAKGDWVILYFSGHGTQVPQISLNPGYREPDRLDEVFLPQDVGRWDPKANQLRNALVDDEIAAIIRPALNKGVSIWAIFDTCHAGDMTKAMPINGAFQRQSVWRSIDPTLLGVPGWSKNKLPINKTLAGEQYQIKNLGSGKLIAYFAAQPDEPAPEEPLLPQQNMGGVFTWHLLQALNQSRPQRPDFGSLMEQIRKRYKQEQRPFPTPYMEGMAAIRLPF